MMACAKGVGGQQVFFMKRREGGGGRQKVILHDKGGGEVRQNMILYCDRVFFSYRDWKVLGWFPEHVGGRRTEPDGEGNPCV